MTILCTNTTFEIPKNAISTKTKDSNQDMYVLLMCSILCHLRLLSALDFHESVTLFPATFFNSRVKVCVCVYIYGDIRIYYIPPLKCKSKGRSAGIRHTDIEKYASHLYKFGYCVISIYYVYFTLEANRNLAIIVF